MLVLSRKKYESILIGDPPVEVAVVEIRGDKVRLGIVAPKEVPVHRSEVAAAISNGVSTRVQKRMDRKQKFHSLKDAILARKEAN